jgi:hypothetical protein
LIYAATNQSSRAQTFFVSLLDPFLSTDAQTASDTLSNNLESLGLVDTEPLITAVQDLASDITPNPTFQQVAAFPEKKNTLLRRTRLFFGAQPGLQNFTTDETFQEDEDAQSLIELLNSFDGYLETLDPKSAFEDIATNSDTTDDEANQEFHMLKSVSNTFYYHDCGYPDEESYGKVME